jgi:hypothetical protein
MMKTIAAAALALFVCSACGGPLDSPATTAGHSSQAVEAHANVVPLPNQPTRLQMDIIDVVDVTDIVVTPMDRITELRTTGPGGFQETHITTVFQHGAGCGCGCGGH